jgi:hypothetical protein
METLKRKTVQKQFNAAHEERIGKEWHKDTYPDYHKAKYEKTKLQRTWTEADQRLEDDLWNS